MGDYIWEIMAASAYLFGMPMLVWLFCKAYKKVFITRRAQKLRPQDMDQLPQPLGKKLKRHLGFTVKMDDRTWGKMPLNNKRMFWVLWVLGLVVTVLGGVFSNLSVIFLGLMMFFLPLIYSIATSRKMLAQRDAIFNRIFETVNFKMHYGAKKAENPASLIKISEWEDMLQPKEIRISIPLSFDQAAAPEFMRHFNQNLSRFSTDAEERSWVAKTADGKAPGWDFGGSLLTVRTVPPLPTMAKFDAHYLHNERCAWSFFPLGLGIENGVEMIHPETGATENVIGIDVSGEQGKLGKKKGFPVSGTIMVSPMALVGGGTGGGKSLAVNTIVPVVKKDRES